MGAPICLLFLHLPSYPTLQVTTFQRNLPSMCLTQRPATPSLRGPRPSEWIAPQVSAAALTVNWLTEVGVPARVEEEVQPHGRSGARVKRTPGTSRPCSGLRLLIHPHRPCCIHAASGDGTTHGGQGLPALLLHQGPQQAGKLQ